MKTVTKYLSKDGREHDTPEQAEDWDKSIKLRDLLYVAASGSPKVDKYFGYSQQGTSNECWSIACGIKRRNPDYLDPLIAALEGVENTTKEN